MVYLLYDFFDRNTRITLYDYTILYLTCDPKQIIQVEIIQNVMSNTKATITNYNIGLLTIRHNIKCKKKKFRIYKALAFLTPISLFLFLAILAIRISIIWLKDFRSQTRPD